MSADPTTEIITEAEAEAEAEPEAAPQVAEEGVTTPATCDVSKDSSAKPCDSCRQSEASSKRRKNMRRKKRGSTKLPSTTTRVAALLGQIKEICKKEPSVASKVEPLLEQATRILESLIIEKTGAESPHERNSEAGAYVGSAVPVVSGQRIPPHVYRPVAPKPSPVVPRVKNEARSVKKPALSNTERTALEHENQQAAVRSRFRNARTIQEMEQALHQAEALGMTHELQHAKTKKEKMLAVV